MDYCDTNINIGTYQPSVRVGNWKEDMVLEEILLKDFLEKRDKGELLIQKTSNLKNTILKQTNLSASPDGFLHFGDVVMLVNPDASPACDSVCLALNPDVSALFISQTIGTHSEVSAYNNLDPCARNTFVITSVDGSPQGDSLRYGQNFALRTTECVTGQLYLSSDHRTFMKCAKKCRLQEVVLTDEASYLTCWQVMYFDPQMRIEYEGLPVPANIKLLIVHSKTNQCLAVLRDYILWSYFGKEYEVTAKTYRDSHKAEETVNHWIIVTSNPSADEKSMFTRPRPPFEHAEDENKMGKPVKFEHAEDEKMGKPVKFEHAEDENKMGKPVKFEHAEDVNKMGKHVTFSDIDEEQK